MMEAIHGKQDMLINVNITRTESISKQTRVRNKK